MKKELEVILNSTHDAMIAVNQYGQITLFNRAAERLTGIHADYAIGRPVEKVILNTRLPFILKTGKYELNQEQDLGNIKIVTNRMPVIDEVGNVIGAVAVFRDITDVLELAEEITDLKKIKSMMEAIFNATEDAISVVDERGINIMINPAYTRLTGLSAEDILGKVATADIAQGESIHMEVLRCQEVVKNARMSVGPRRIDVLASAAPIKVDEVLKGSVAVLSDVTKMRKLTEDLDTAKRIIRNLEAKYDFDDIIGTQEVLVSCIEKAKRAADLNLTVLLKGESGTGKELFAHAIHNHGNRKYNKFVKINCASLSETLLESELFGYEEGAFSGAIKGGKRGLFEEADHGTLFLDEIGEMSLNLQAKLLRVLQEKEMMKVGGVKTIPIDVRVIAATNRDLEGAIRQKNFRADLYYRLNMYPIEIPPLRKRKKDIPILCAHLIKKLNVDYGRMTQGISQESCDYLVGYDWPGNVRELENILGRALITMEFNESTIEIHHLPQLHDLEHRALERHGGELKKTENTETLHDFLKRKEQLYIQQVLLETKNKEEAAKKLDISIRSLYYKLNR